MAGLLEKDFRLIMQRKQMIGVFLLLALILGFTMDGPFILGYLPFLALVIMISTISYDELDNGYQFLMTLPITAKTYVVEKYLFCIGGIIVSWVLSGILYFLSMDMRGTEVVFSDELSVVFTFLPIIILVSLIMIPLQIKFGAEKSRMVIVGIGGAAVVLCLLLDRVIGADYLNRILMRLNRLSDCVIVLAVSVFTILATGISGLISYRIMKNKEF